MAQLPSKMESYVTSICNNEALSYNHTKYRKWKNNADFHSIDILLYLTFWGVVLQRGHVECRIKTCDPAPCPDPRKYPGECCPLCPKSCTYKNVTLVDGESFKPEGEDRCTECVCLVGKVNVCFISFILVPERCLVSADNHGWYLIHHTCFYWNGLFNFMFDSHIPTYGKHIDILVLHLSSIVCRIVTDVYLKCLHFN